MGRLDPAGVDLQAKGFKEYLSRLDRVEKKNREVFDQQFKGTKKSFDEVKRAAKAYEQQIESARKEQERFRREQEKSRIEQKKLATAQRRQRGLIVGGAALGAAALGTREIVRFGKESVNLAREQIRVEAQLATAIQSTGGAAGISSRELRNLASELQGVTNFGDETTIAAEALLLTFTNIGRDVFPETVKLTQDMATALRVDLSQAALQVGKALNDPVRGLTALRRANIQFTPEQEALVKGFVEVNDVASAQRVILAELNRQFGGSAVAARKADGGIIALGNSFGDLQEEVGTFLLALNQSADGTNRLIDFVDALTGSLRGLSAALGIGDISDEIAGLEADIAILEKFRDASEETAQTLSGGLETGASAIDILLGKIGLLDPEGDIAEFNQEIAELESQLEGLKTQAVAEDTEELTRAQENAANSTSNLNGELEENESNLNALSSALKRAEGLQLSFARAAEDATRKLERQQAKLARTQARDRDKLLIRQQKDLDKFEESRLKDLENFDKDRVKQIANAEKAIGKAREQAADDRLAAQKRLQLQLRQNEERFRLSQIQSERRFQLSDQRLRAEGDILALQELRENRALEVQEGQENFDLQQRQTKEGGKQISDDRIREQQARLQELKVNLEQERKELEISLEEQRAELLAGFDEQLREQQIAQEEQRADLLRNFAEQQEDRRINQARQLEDLGRSLADQEDLTEVGAKAIADELEKVFGIDGSADTIFQGFSSRTESEFRDLFDTVSNITRSIPLGLGRGRGSSPRGTGGSLDRPLQFQEGGVVPGPIGAPVAAVVHGGETVIPATHQMVAPVIPSQNVNVSMSGGFNITGGEQAGEASVQMAVDEMTTSFEIAVRRLIRKG